MRECVCELIICAGWELLTCESRCTNPSTPTSSEERILQTRKLGDVFMVALLRTTCISACYSTWLNTTIVTLLFPHCKKKLFVDFEVFRAFESMRGVDLCIRRECSSGIQRLKGAGVWNGAAFAMRRERFGEPWTRARLPLFIMEAS